MPAQFTLTQKAGKVARKKRRVDRKIKEFQKRTKRKDRKILFLDSEDDWMYSDGEDGGMPEPKAAGSCGKSGAACKCPGKKGGGAGTIGGGGFKAMKRLKKGGAQVRKTYVKRPPPPPPPRNRERRAFQKELRLKQGLLAPEREDLRFIKGVPQEDRLLRNVATPSVSLARRVDKERSVTAEAIKQADRDQAMLAAMTARGMPGPAPMPPPTPRAPPPTVTPRRRTLPTPSGGVASSTPTPIKVYTDPPPLPSPSPSPVTTRGKKSRRVALTRIGKGSGGALTSTGTGFYTAKRVDHLRKAMRLADAGHIEKALKLVQQQRKGAKDPAHLAEQYILKQHG